MTEPGRVVRLSGWGRYPVADCRLASPSGATAAARLADKRPSLIARGCGRSYGDSSLNPELTLATGGMDRLLAFDEAAGLLECESGVKLSDLIDTFLPRGWISPVTPGTRFVTVGGMIAADVHGKNHHRDGSFCDHLDWIDLALPGGRVERCGRERNADLFEAACGGMGLAGLILRAAFRLKRVESAQIRQRTLRAANLGAAIDLFEASLESPYAVAWIDCMARGLELGRSVLFLGEHAPVEALPPGRRADPFRRSSRRTRRVPADLPAFALGPLSVRLFNTVYWSAQRTGERLVDMEPYFYPLDSIAEWNRIYGRRGFVQYQCVLPLETSRAGITILLERIAAAGSGSFLAVLKRLGGQSFGLLSFPMAGYTLALDFPATRANLALLDELDSIVADHGGRIYLAKDSRTSAAAVAAGYGRIDEFREVRRRWGLDGKYSSLQSRRLEL
jgi:FAD/FMN-containing dehydrogenase